MSTGWGCDCGVSLYRVCVCVSVLIYIVCRVRDVSIKMLDVSVDGSVS